MTFARLILPALALTPGLPPHAAQEQDGPGLALPADLAARTGPEGLSFAEEYKRTLIYHAGATQVFQETVGILLELETQRRRAAGDDLAWIDLSDEAVEARIRYSQQKLRETAPQADFWEVLKAQGYDRETYPTEVRRTLLLDGLFFPPDPDRWPPAAREIFPPQKEGAEFDDFVASQYERLQAAKAQGQPVEVDETLKELLLRPTAIQWLWDQARVAEPWDGLPEGVALRVGDKPVGTDELLARVLPKVTEVDRERAAAWVELVWELKAALKRDLLLLSREETNALMEEEMKEYENSPFSYEQVATEFLGFPSMQAYKEYYRLRYSFKQALPDPLPDEVLREHLQRHGSFFGDGKVEADVILCSALDLTIGAFPRTGDPFAAAEAKARRAAAELAEGGDWSAVLAKYSDYPESYPGAHPGMPQPHRGRFGLSSRVPLRDFLGENEYTDFLLGSSIGDAIFYDAEPGAAYGPVRGAQGWYLYRLRRRTAPTRAVDPVNNERQRFVVSDDYLSLRFGEYIAKAMSSGG